MAATQGIVRVHQEGTTVTFRVEGRATMLQSLPLRRFAERRLAEGAAALRIDLRQCSYMDSTFLGTLLTLQGAITRRGEGTLTLLSPATPCARILQQMGLGAVFHTETTDEELPWSDLPADTGDDTSFKRNVAQAHEELANLPGPVGEQFRAVTRCLAQAEKAPPPKKGGSE
jgi:anti-anti-sigma factor